jgi:hypothetical protein
MARNDHTDIMRQLASAVDYLTLDAIPGLTVGDAIAAALFAWLDPNDAEFPCMIPWPPLEVTDPLRVALDETLRRTEPSTARPDAVTIDGHAFSAEAGPRLQ